MSLLSNLNLREIPGGTVLHLRVKPGARRNEILGVHGGALKLGVVARPDKGKANRGVLKLLAKILGLAPSAIPAAAESGYLIGHSTVMYLMGPDGAYLTHFSHGSTADGIAQTLAQNIGG